jgi:hypothetical protein
VPATEVEFDDRHKSVNRIFDVGHGKEGVWMSHETSRISVPFSLLVVAVDITSLSSPTLTFPRG